MISFHRARQQTGPSPPEKGVSDGSHQVQVEDEASFEGGLEERIQDEGSRPQRRPG